jgi:hypothetical protein
MGFSSIPRVRGLFPHNINHQRIKNKIGTEAAHDPAAQAKRMRHPGSRQVNAPEARARATRTKRERQSRERARRVKLHKDAERLAQELARGDSVTAQPIASRAIARFAAQLAQQCKAVDEGLLEHAQLMA